MWAQTHTFAQVLHNVYNNPLSQLPSPSIKEDVVLVHMVEEVYLVGMQECKNHLHGCILLTKEDKPIMHFDLYKKLDVGQKHLGQ